MVEKKQILSNRDLKSLHQSLQDFKKVSLIYPPFTIKIPIAKWDLRTFGRYNKLKKAVSKFKKINKQNKKGVNLISNVWILLKYVFESVFIISHLILFYLYMTRIPVYKGMISFYVGFFIFSYFIMSRSVMRYNGRVIRRIDQILQHLKN